MARTVALYVLPAGLIASGWLGLEQTPRAGAALALAALALVPALLRSRLAVRLAATFAAAAVALHTALGVSVLDARPFDDRHDFFGPALSRFRDGLLGFYEVNVPFAAAAHPRMHGLVLLAIFGFCLAVALAIAARRPFTAAFALVVGAVWPVTLLESTNEVQRGALILVAVLTLLATLRGDGRRPQAQALVAGAAVLVCALGAAASPAVAKTAFLDWEHWNPAATGEKGVSVSYVWNATYDGIRFPNKVTEVLEIEAPADRMYWRATTLDAFFSDRWVEESSWIEFRSVDGRDILTRDAFLGPRGRNGPYVEQEVKVSALVDDHLIAASVPVMYEPGDIEPIAYAAGGIAWAPGLIRPGDRYKVWSYVAQPSPAQLRQLPAKYPALVKARTLRVAHGMPALPPYGAPNRERWMRSFLTGAWYDDRVAPYRPLYERARQVTATARSPYEVVVALESWLRSAGGFRYEERPPVARTRPPLVDFVLRTKSGYCQHFAGAMALMLRYLGIPARVAVGFTSGRYDRDDETWTVTDHNAHAWVEAWFPRYGWLPFDPTPGRGTLSGTYTAASPSFNPFLAAAALAKTVGLSATELEAQLAQRAKQDAGASASLLAQRESQGGGVSGRVRLEQRGDSLVAFLLIVAGILAGLVVTVKLARRRLRYLRRDPRSVASACRQELVDFLVDQRVEVPRSATITELGQLLETKLSVPARPFVAAANAARFAPPAESETAARRSRRELRMLLRQIRGRLQPSRRLRGLLSLRSLGFT